MPVAGCSVCLEKFILVLLNVTREMTEFTRLFLFITQFPFVCYCFFFFTRLSLEIINKQCDCNKPPWGQALRNSSGIFTWCVGPSRVTYIVCANDKLSLSHQSAVTAVCLVYKINGGNKYEEEEED